MPGWYAGEAVIGLPLMMQVNLIMLCSLVIVLVQVLNTKNLAVESNSAPVITPNTKFKAISSKDVVGDTFQA